VKLLNGGSIAHHVNNIFTPNSTHQASEYWIYISAWHKTFMAVKYLDILIIVVTSMTNQSPSTLYVSIT
jgi:hypothetical protein